ncbi:major tail protein [Sporolactobacillus terrae]|uniref:Phage tail protein n=1 Tax=Sporolactobacillus terrae TaxID=269673 RepID=A0A5K7X2J6_9BACL|nr:major tail protein [Sporolactobacillus terrae]BBN99158.1 phage tail protein [Sporolactobacillus terrae]
MPKNKVRYGLSNVYFAIIDEENGVLTYRTPIKWPGAVNLSLEAQGDPVNFYADNGTYFNEPTNNGYDGTLEMALIPDEFRKEVLAESVANGVQFEDGNAKGYKKFALLFQFEGDQKAIRHVIYYCSASRPTEEGATVEDAKEVQTTELEFQARKRPDNGLVKARCTDDAPDEVYDNWYQSVYDDTVDQSGQAVG